MGSSVSLSRADLRVNKKSEKDNENRQKSIRRQESSASRDVMISYSHTDMEMMSKLRTSLEAAGFTVWVDVTGLKAGVDFLSKIGEAIIDSKMFISLLSTASVNSKYCQDELALAYVSNKPIFPVIIESYEQLSEEMHTGMKLQLAGFEWNLFADQNIFDDNFEKLSAKMHAEIAKIDYTSANRMSDNAEETKEIRAKVNRQASHNAIFIQKMQSLNTNLNEQKMLQFWELKFKKQYTVPWESFVQGFLSDYQSAMNTLFSQTDQDWLMTILARELSVDECDGNVTKENYTVFCTVDGKLHPFWIRVHDQAVESYAMKEVFDMDSSVRVQAIENLGKFHSTAVIEALLDLLQDSDNNVKAVAAISLARTGSGRADVNKALLKCLNSKDRLVRESGCLALGHRKVAAAVPKLVQLWRNDFISHVREAAQVALEKIGGEEANKAMHMTKVLADEIKMLTFE